MRYRPSIVQPPIPYHCECIDRAERERARALMQALFTAQVDSRKFNLDGLDYVGWLANANFTVPSSRHVSGPVAKLAWARREDPTEWAAQSDSNYNEDPRPGEYVRDDAELERRYTYIVGYQKSACVVFCVRRPFKTHSHYSGALNEFVINFYMPWQGRRWAPKQHFTG